MKNLLLATGLLFLGSLAVQAQTLAVNFNDDTSRQGQALASTDTAGATGVVSDNWNNVGGATDFTGTIGSSGTLTWTDSDLTTGGGIGSGVSLSASTTNTGDGPDGLWGQGGGYSGASGDTNLFAGGLQIRTATVTFSLSNLSSLYGSGPYDLYAYFSGGSDVGGNGQSVTVGNGTLSDTISPTGYTGAYTDGTDASGDYILFTGLTGNSQTFTVQSTVGFSDPQTSLAGIELVKVGVPEPASYLLLAAGLLALLVLRRRRV